METKIIDTNENKEYDGLDLPIIPIGTMISLREGFAARRVVDVQLYVPENRQVLFCGLMSTSRFNA